MKKLFIAASALGLGVMPAALALGSSAVHAAGAPVGGEGCIAGAQGAVTNGGYVVIGAVGPGAATPSSAPAFPPAANCAYEASVAPSGYSAGGTYSITYGVGTLVGTTSCNYANSSGTGNNPTTTISSANAATPVTANASSGIPAGVCIQVHTGP